MTSEDIKHQLIIIITDQRMTKLQLSILGTADSVKLLFGTVCGMERLKQLGLDRQVRTWSVAMRGRFVLGF